MKWFLLWALGGAGAVIVAACIAVLFARHRFRRHHRVDPKVATDAPALWAVDPRPAARLHRRLARMGTLAAQIAEDHRPAGRRLGRRPEPSPIGRAAEDLLAQAVALDNRLSRLSVLAPGARRAPLAELTAAVTDLETAAARLAVVSSESRMPRQLTHDDPGLTAVQDRIGHIAEALGELDRLDERAGLQTAAPRTATAAAPPPPAHAPVPPQTEPSPR